MSVAVGKKQLESGREIGKSTIFILAVNYFVITNKIKRQILTSAKAFKLPRAALEVKSLVDRSVVPSIREGYI